MGRGEIGIAFFGDKMKVVVCQINSKFVHSSLAAWCLKAGALRFCKSSNEVKVVEGTINEKLDSAVVRIAEEAPDVVGFCCYIWNISYVLALAERVRELCPAAKIVLGGPEVSYNADAVLKAHGFVDFILSGEGEYPFARLIDGISEGAVPEGDGICFLKNGDVQISAPYISCEEPPSPYCEEYFKTLGGRIAYFETSRGCPYSCAFCLSGRCGGVRYFDLDRVKKEILLLANSGTQTVKFVDRTFNANKKRAKEIVSFILSENGVGIPDGVCFHFEVAGDILDDEFISLLTEAPKGLFQLEIGMQSFNEATLEAINRRTDCEKLKTNIMRFTSARNMHIHVDLIAGLPLEGLESFKESFNTAYSLNANMLQLGFLKLLHGAPMRESAEKYPCVFNSTPPYEVISTPYITEDELALLKKVEDLVDRTYNSGRFRLTLDYALSLCNSPFELFEELSKAVAIKPKITLDDFTEQLFHALGDFKGIDRVLLRDLLVCDRICSSSDGRLPDFLKISDPFLKTAKHFLEKNPATARGAGIRRSVALLYGERTVVWCDHTEQDKISGRYELCKIDFDRVTKFGD